MVRWSQGIIIANNSIFPRILNIKTYHTIKWVKFMIYQSHNINLWGTNMTLFHRSSSIKKFSINVLGAIYFGKNSHKTSISLHLGVF